MSTNPIRKPSAASESFITALAILFFASLAILFLWLDNKKHPEKQTRVTNHEVYEKPVAIAGNAMIKFPFIFYYGG